MCANCPYDQLRPEQICSYKIVCSFAETLYSILVTQIDYLVYCYMVTDYVQSKINSKDIDFDGVGAFSWLGRN